MKKIAVIINPDSGRGMGLGMIQHFKTFSGNDLKFDFKVSRSEDHLKILACKTFENYSKIIVVGGDTTFTIIIGEIIKKYQLDSEHKIAEAFKNKTFGMLGLGSANDISDELNTNTLKELINAIQKSQIRKMDLGELRSGKKSRFFLGSASLGLGVFINRYLEDFKK